MLFQSFFFSLVHPGYEVFVNLLFIMTSFSYGLFPLAKNAIVKISFFLLPEIFKRVSDETLVFENTLHLTYFFLQTSCVKFATARDSYANISDDVMTSQDYTYSEHPMTCFLSSSLAKIPTALV